MNIWIIDHYAQPEKYKALIRQTLFAKNFISMGHDVRIFCASTVHNTSINLIGGNELYKEEIVDGVAYTYVRCRDYSGNGLRRIINMYEFSHRVGKVCNEYIKKGDRPDCILCCSLTLQACNAGIRIAKRNNAKAVAQITDLWPESIISYGYVKPRNPIALYLRLLEKRIYSRCDALVFSMENAYSYIEERHLENVVPRDKVYYINNGVEIDRFCYNKSHYHVDDPDLSDNGLFKAVYVGSIRRVNDLGRLLEAAKHVKNKSVRFLIWGDGDELEKLKSRAEAESISNVSFKGRVEKKYIPYITSCADLNLMHGDSGPVLRFGLSANKLFDYLAAGKPILTDFPCGHNPADAYGASVEIKDYSPEGIAEAIDACAAMPPEQRDALGANAQKAASEYDFSNLARRLLEVITA